LHCNPASIPTCGTATLPAASNECGPVNVTCSQPAPDTVSGCNHSRTLTFTATDLCSGLQSTCTRTYTWKVDTTPPVLSGLPSATASFQCVTLVPNPPTVTANDNCDGTVTVSYSQNPASLTGLSSCNLTIMRSWSAQDSCGNATNFTQTITVKDTNAPSITCPGPVTVQCASDVPAPDTNKVTATDCSGPVSVSWVGDVMSNSNCPNSFTLTRTYKATDACSNSSTCTQTITVHDTTAPSITCPLSLNVLCESFTPITNVTTLTSNQLAQLGVIVSDNCGGTVTVTVKDTTASNPGDCPKVYTRLFTATDGCGNTNVCHQTITCYCDTLITDTMLCTLPTGLCGSSGNNQFNLLFTQDPQNHACYKLTSSNPGQFYYNVFFTGTPGSLAVFTFSIPYPFVTQGAQAVHAYDGLTTSTSGGVTCLTPGNLLTQWSTNVTISSYTPQKMGSFASVTVQVTVPASGFVYLNMHLDYGLKQTTDFGQDGSGNATVCGNPSILIPNGQTYLFGNQTIQSCNSFKKNSGVGGPVGSSNDR
jgi:hypothetical protein